MISEVNSILESTSLMDLNKWIAKVDCPPPFKSIPSPSIEKRPLLDLKPLLESSISLSQVSSENFFVILATK